MFNYIKPVYIIFIILSLISLDQCFLGISEYYFLSLRGIDEVAFHQVLNNYFNKSGVEFLSMHGYAYGWIFWFPITVISYPFWYLNMDAIVILIPRLHALFFSLGTCYYIYKTSSIFTNNELLKTLIVFLNPIYPLSGFMATRFGTIPMADFFAVASIYYILKNEVFNRHELRISLTLFSIGLAVKLSNVVLLPMLCLLIIKKYIHNEYSIILIIKEIFLSIILFVFLLEPIFIFSFLDFNEAKNAVNLFYVYTFERAGHADFINNFTEALSYKYSYIVYTIMGIGLVCMSISSFYSQYQKNRINELIILVLGGGIGFLYLAYSVPVGSTYVWLYSLCCLWTIPFSLIGFELLLERFRCSVCVYIVNIIAIICFGFSLLNLYDYVKKDVGMNFMHAYKMYDTSEALSIKKGYDILADRIKNEDRCKIIASIDSLGPLSILHNWSKSNHIPIYGIWDNIDDDLYKTSNIIILSKKNNAYKHLLDNEYRTDDIVELKDLNVRRLLIENNIFNEQKYECVYEDVYMLIYVLKYF